VSSWLRAYWSALLLALAAIVLLSLSVPTKEAITGAGFALLGAAITRSVDLAKERSAEAAQADATRRHDLDETRRLAYAALVSDSGPANSVLVATLVNALAHHGSEVDPNVAATHVKKIVNDRDPDDESRRWLLGQIDRMTAELGP
jgi:hypothetical protein